MSQSLSRIVLTALAATPLALGAATSMAAPCVLPNLWHIVDPEQESQTVYEVKVSLLALWRPAFGVVPPDPELQIGYFGLPSRVNQPGDYRSIADFEIYKLNGELRFALVYAGMEATEDLEIGLSPSQLTELFDDGQTGSVRGNPRHLADLETYLDGAQRRYAALFVNGSRPQDLELQMSGNAIQTRVEQSVLTMRGLADFELLSPGNEITPPSFAVVFEEYQRSQRFFPDLGNEEFHHKIHEQNIQGYQLTNVEIWRDSEGDNHYAALFEISASDDHLYGLQCSPGSPCLDQNMVDLVSDHVTFAVGNVADAKPTLRLVDLELPFGRVESPQFVPLAGASDGATRKRPRANGEEGLVIAVGPPTCQHGGVLHDGGTNGPPPWP